MPFLFYLPLIIWSGFVSAAQSGASKKNPRG
jgi:hypothetical protein